MAMNMDALLRIKAAVTGSESVAALGGKLKQVEGAAQTLTSKVGPLGGALSALAPVATVGGLTALVKKTIETGDAMYDMSQRTGVSVESLAKFRKAASTSGTDIDAVAKSLGKLSKGLYEAATTGKGATAEALKALGVSATDAAGKLKTADQVTLEIANKFKVMPDGVQKTALAMQLFGKAGAEMIPMLNMGGDAIDKLKVKMTSAFAQKADEYSDKLTALGGKVGGLAAGLSVALLPALDAMVTAVTAVVDAFTKLPGPIQTIIGGLALLAVGFAALSPVLAGLSVALSALAGTGLATALLAPFQGLLAFMTSTFLPAMLAFFSGPAGWITLAVIAVGAMVYAFREPIGKFLGWIGEQLTGLGKLIGDGLAAIGKAILGAVVGIGKTVRDGIGGVWNWLTSSMSNIAAGLAKPFQAGAEAIKSVLRSVLQFGANVINGFLGAINQMINGVNSIAARLKLPTLPNLPMVSVPRFEGGGYTGDGPRAGGLDGRGGFMAMLHPRETVIDHARSRSASRWAGARMSGAGYTARALAINIKTGPVYRLPDGTDTVSVGDLQAAMQATASAIMGQLRRPGAQLALGIR